MYLIVGGNGFLGNYIIKSILEKTDDMIVATARNTENTKNSERLIWKTCDIENETQFDKLIASLPDVEHLKVIFLAAYHHPDMVAKNPQTAWNINVTTLSRCLNKLYFARRFFYASTDSVYGNSVDRHHFRETDALNPVNVYGHNKAAAEALVCHYGFNVVRFPFLIAPSLVAGKLHFYDKIVCDLKQGKEVAMFCDSYRSSLNFKTGADLLTDLAELEVRPPAILNICGDDDLSKYDIGLMIADKIAVSRSLVKALKLQDGETIFKTARASTTLMDNAQIKKVLKIPQIKFEL